MVIYNHCTVSFTAKAQSLEKMQWFNEPEQWKIEDNSLLMYVTPQTDYWRISHYGFTVDDAPFLYTLRGGKFEVKRIDHENYIKAVRRLDAVEIFYSFDDKEYTMMRNAWLQDNHPVMVGVMGACPDGDGFNARFENFSIRHLPDMRRLEWLMKNSAVNRPESVF